MLRMRTLPAGFIAPCLPTKTDKLPSGSDWLHEIKHDGFRVIARKLSVVFRMNSIASVCSAVQSAGSRGYATLDQLESQAWITNPPAAARVPYTTQPLPVARPYREGKPRLEVKGAARSRSGLSRNY